ncbi:TPA: hypothetical protein PIJ84_002124 [Staphylococcus aureus]|nr:hypothetical protein [Staphylococcus aureus]HBH9983563.1 hypothetical protein [Staphylococcus aureus]HBH9986603.1 hypothetical protein [Staphylococcus aureus]HDH5591710.1 hypothetical protein [Staphylococcus aureus]HDP5857349.1 hypothetical protein [Staphylococcus aureus]
MNIFKKSRDRYHLSVDYVSKKTAISIQVINRLENDEINNTNYSSEITCLAEFYNLALTDVHSNISPHSSFIARHKGTINSHDKMQITKLYKLQEILG